MTKVSCELRMTRHAEARMRQRSVRDADVDLLLRYGSADGEAVTMTDADIRREVACRKREIERIERLRGVTIIIVSGAMVTVYRENRGRHGPHRGRED